MIETDTGMAQPFGVVPLAENEQRQSNELLKTILIILAEDSVKLLFEEETTLSNEQEQACGFVNWHPS